MKHLKFFTLLLTVTISSLYASAEIIGDSVASIVNNWDKGEYATYRNYSGRITIEGRDTIIEREGPETISKLLLADVLPDDDKVFVVTTEYPDSAGMIKTLSEQSMFTITTENGTEEENTSQTAKHKAELYSQFLKLMEKPITLITDFSGEVKDIYDYDSLRSELDSCFEHVKGNIARADLPDGTMLALMLNMQRLWNQVMSKESLMKRFDLFRFYGYNYPFGTTIDNVKLPLLTEDIEVDATVTFSCEPVETEEGTELVEITSLTSYDSDQVMDYVMSAFLSEEEKKKTSLKDPDRPYISMNVSEKFLFEPQKGTLVEYIRQKLTASPEKTVIDFTVTAIE